MNSGLRMNNQNNQRPNKQEILEQSWYPLDLYFVSTRAGLYQDPKTGEKVFLSHSIQPERNGWKRAS